jgi:HSP20 family protein
MIVRRLGPSRPTFVPTYNGFDEMRRDMFRLFGALADHAGTQPSAGVFPAVNVTQDTDSFYVRAELPGVAADDLDISAVHRTLTIKGERKAPDEEGVSYHRRERAGGVFSRSITLPSEFDAERIDARYKDGLLRLTLPKPERLKPRQITVKTS